RLQPDETNRLLVAPTRRPLHHGRTDPYLQRDALHTAAARQGCRANCVLGRRPGTQTQAGHQWITSSAWPNCRTAASSRRLRRNRWHWLMPIATPTSCATSQPGGGGCTTTAPVGILTTRCTHSIGLAPFAVKSHSNAIVRKPRARLLRQKP